MAKPLSDKTGDKCESSYGYLSFSLLLALSAKSYAQCSSNTTQFYYNDSATRLNSDTVHLENDFWVDATTGDGSYSTYAVKQTDYYGGTQIGLSITGTGQFGSEAYTYRNVPLTATGYNFSQFETIGALTAYDTCSGRSYPPFDSGPPSASATITIPRPAISGNSSIWLRDYDLVSSNNCYPISTTLAATPNGATATPHWTLSPASWGTSGLSFISLSCVDCSATTITATRSAIASCGGVALVQYTVGNLPSTQVAIFIKDGHQTVGLSPTTNQHVDNVAIAGISGSGYQSTWYWTAQGSCQVPMPDAAAYEAFPSGFKFDTSGTQGWGTPSANSWATGSEGGWLDNIGETCGGRGLGGRILPGCTPAAEPPQTPLTNTLIYDGLQNVYLGPSNASKLIFTGDQGHWLDHGGYTSQTLEP
jgi:hypothetical protein